jgi:hypothetical protein
MVVSCAKGTPLAAPIAIDLISHILIVQQGMDYFTSFMVVLLSLYADGAAIFVAPFNEDIQNLTNILSNFGELAGI